MSQDAWTTVGVVAVMVAVMAANIAGPDLVLVGGLTLLLASGVLDPAEAFVGFANPAVVTIGALFIVAAGVRETGALDFAARRMLGAPTSTATAQLRIMAPVGFLSGFLNNTPVVALMVPLIQRWSTQIRVSPSLLLMPLSYAAILGGTCTLIGTSTNLLVAGMLAARAPSEALGMFDMTPIGLPVLILGTGYVLLFSRRLLEPRHGTRRDAAEAKEYAIAFRVQPGSPVVGQTIDDCLRSLPKLFLFELERNGAVIPAVPPETKLQVDDVLVFAGIVVDAARDLRKMGLVPEADQLAKLSGRRGWIEAVVAARGPMVGKTVRESRFRTVYNAAILAVHRQGERVSSKVGDIVLQPGDVLLVEGSSSFARANRADSNFVLISAVDDSIPPAHDKAWVAAVILVAMVGVNAAGLMPLLTASLLAAAAVVVTRCISPAGARNALDLKVLVTVGSALGIGFAVDKSGAAQALGENLTALFAPMGVAPLLIAIFAATAILAGLVYTATAAALMFPVAATIAEARGIPLQGVAIVVMFAASTAFSTPIGYAANLMVYGPGGYRYSDFLKLGLPLQILIAIITISAVTTFYI